MPMADYRHLFVQPEGDVLRVTLNRPQVLNALNSEMRSELRRAAAMFAADDRLGAMLLAGAGDRAFCAGQDLAESQTFGGETARGWIDEFDALYRAFRELEKPVVAMVQGWATGAGFQLVLLADLRIGSDGARFAMTELDVGIPCITGYFLLEQIVGRGHAAELTLTCRRVDAAEAHELGILTRLVDAAELGTVAMETAHCLAAKPRSALLLQKRHLRNVSETGFRATIEAAAAAHGEAFASGEPQRLMAEFVARRARG